MTDRPLTPLVRHLHQLAGLPAMPNVSDTRLVEQFVRRRDEDAFAALVRRHGPMVWRVCLRVLRQAHQAEEAYQATFLVLARRAAKVRKPAALTSFLYGVAYRIARKARADILRRHSCERVSATAPAADPGCEAAWRELEQIVVEEIQALPEKYRTPILLCYWEGLTNEEMAIRLSWPAGTVKTRLLKARQLLHARLTRRGVGLSAGVFATLLAAGGGDAGAPPSLAVSAIRLALDGTAGTPAPVAALVEQAVQGMAWSKGKILVVLLLGSAITVGVGAFAAHQSTARRPEPEQEARSERPKIPQGEQSKPRTTNESARTDGYGDPLPPGAIARFGTAHFRHEGEASSLVFSPTGKILAALTAGGTILWDARTGKELRRFPEMRGAELTIGRLIDFSPDGRMLAGSRDSNHVGLWDAATGKLLRAIAVRPKNKVIEPPGSGLHTIRFSPDGKFLAVQGDANRSYVLDTATGEALHHFKDEIIGGLTFSPDSKMLGMGVLVRGKPKANEIQVRDVRTGKVLRRWQGHSELMCDLAFSPDGKTLAAGGTDRITLWDAATGEVRTQIEKKMGQVKNLAFTPDGKTLVCGSESDGKIHVWDSATGKEQRQLDPRLSVLRSMALSADGKTVAAGTVYNTIRLWDLATGRELFPDQPGHNASVNSVAYSPDGKLLVSAGENRQVWLWDTATGKPVRQIRMVNARAIAFSPDGQRFALLSSGKDIHVCEVATGKGLFRLPPGDVWGVNALAYSPDGKMLVSADYLAKGKNDVVCNLNVWDASTGRFLRRSSIAGIRPDSLAFRGDGRTLAIGGASDRELIRLWDLERGEEILALGGHERPVITLAFSPDGRTLVSSSDDRTARLWEVATGKEIAVLKSHEQEVATVAFSPNGRIVASGGAHPIHGEGGANTIRLWDAATGEDIQHFQGHSSGVASVAFSPDGARLASGLRNSTVLLWEVPRGSRHARRLTPRDLGLLWSDLAGEGAHRAHAAIRKLSEDPEQTVAFLRDHLRPAPQTDPEQFRRLIAKLDSDKYAARQAAAKELAALGELAGPLLRERLAAKPSLEIRKRVEELLAQTKVLHAGEVVRGMRAVEALERIGTSGARQVLQALANGAAEARLTREAKASLERLAKRRAVP